MVFRLKGEVKGGIPIPIFQGIPARDELHSTLNKWEFTFFFPRLWVVLSCFYW